MIIAGAILCPDDATEQHHHAAVKASVETLHELAVDPVIVVGSQRLVQHPSIKNRYERFGAFGPLMSALMWVKATPVVTISWKVSSPLLESFVAQLRSNDFAVAAQAFDENLLIIGTRDGDAVSCSGLGPDELTTQELQKVLNSPALWPPNSGSSLRKSLTKSVVNDEIIPA